MNKALSLLLSLIFFSAPSFASVIIDHTAAKKFDSLSSLQVLSAAQVRILLRHASVGQCISAGLDALGPDYDRTNFAFQPRGNPGWQAKIDDLAAQVKNQRADFDVFSQKFCYIDAGASPAAYIKAMEQLQAAYPGKLFVWWTMPLTTAGDAKAQAFNKAVRAHAKANNRILFDIAAIESHHANGKPFVKHGFECLCPEYTEDGGHPNRAASVRLAKAYWVLASRLAELVGH